MIGIERDEWLVTVSQLGLISQIITSFQHPARILSETSHCSLPGCPTVSTSLDGCRVLYKKWWQWYPITFWWARHTGQPTHFILKCEKYSTKRCYFIRKIENTIPSFGQQSDRQKLRVILGSSDYDICKIAISYINEIYNERKSQK